MGNDLVVDCLRVLPQSHLSRRAVALKRSQDDAARLVSVAVLAALLLSPKNAAASVAREKVRGDLEQAVVLVERRCGGVLVEPGLVVTARHCIEDLDRNNIRMEFSDGTKLSGSLVAMDAEADVVLLSVPRTHGRTAIPLATTLHVRAGDPVLVAGHPLDVQFAVAMAEYRGRQDTRFAPSAIVLAGFFIEGNSGGPVVCLDGHLHGVVAARSHDHRLGIAVPSERIRSLLASVRPEPPPASPPVVRVVIFAASMDRDCAATEAWLRGRGVTFETRAVRRSEHVRKVYTELLNGAPLIVVIGPKGSEILVGFSPSELRRALRDVR